jgi:predicted thioesterase
MAEAEIGIKIVIRKEMESMLEAGIKGTQEVMVTEANSAKTMGSGALDVFATPAMIALMEKTAWESVQPHLEEGSGTVGTSLNVKHVAATPLGMKVTCESELTKVDGRALTFSVKAYDESGLIGEGEHERFVVINEKFQAKADAKRQGK